MDQRVRRLLTGPVLPISALAAAFLISLVFFRSFPPAMEGRVFFYPVNSGREFGSERRGIPVRPNLDGQITVFLEELLIGPVRLNLARTAPRGTSLRHAVVMERTAYIDLDRRMLNSDGELPISFEEAVENIDYNLRFNFSRIEDVVFTIEGHQVDAPYYRSGKTPENP